MKKPIQLCLRCDNGDRKANKKNKHRGTFREHEVPHHAGKEKKILICHEPSKKKKVKIPSVGFIIMSSLFLKITYVPCMRSD